MKNQPLEQRTEPTLKELKIAELRKEQKSHKRQIIKNSLYAAIPWVAGVAGWVAGIISYANSFNQGAPNNGMEMGFYSIAAGTLLAFPFMYKASPHALRRWKLQGQIDVLEGNPNSYEEGLKMLHGEDSNCNE
jgi:hypothetical protein